METHQEAPPSLSEWLNPLAGWDVATRWNRATFDWMAKGWQQWVALMTTVPPHFLAPPTIDGAEAVAQQLRAARALDARVRVQEAPAASAERRPASNRNSASRGKSKTKKARTRE